MLRHQRNNSRLICGKRHRVTRGVTTRYRTGQRPAIASIGIRPTGNCICDRCRERPPLREELGVISDAIAGIIIGFIANLKAEQAGSQFIGNISCFGSAIRGRVRGQIDAVDDVPVGGQGLDESRKRIHLCRRDRRLIGQSTPACCVHAIAAKPQNGGRNLAEHVDQRDVGGDK